MRKLISENYAKSAAILVAALGYFVDVYDLVLFSVLRVSSLKELGVEGDQLLSQGVFLLNSQMAGMLIGGVLWGVLGDKRGRVSVLFGSILLYSAANIANGFVTSLELYAILRFLAGVGLAGELGAGITLVSEIMPKDSRGLATTFVASVGVAGAVVASLVGDYFHWRTAYFVGGGMGLALLLMRVAVHESGLFESLVHSNSKKGDLTLLFKSKERFFRYLRCVLIGVPIWYGVGILITFCPEIGKALEMHEIPSAGRAIMYCYIGLVIGDVASGLVSQLLRSRKKVVLIFIAISTLFTALMLTSKGLNLSHFYWLSLGLGFGLGYWAVFVTTAAEQFGTNLRATVTTTTPNFVRGSVVLVTSLFEILRPGVGVIYSAGITGALCIGIALIALIGLKESFSTDLDFIET